MLDYSHNEGDRQSFIFDYKILDSADGEKIAVKYANKKIRIVPYSLVTESEIIKKCISRLNMLLQILNLRQ